MTAPVLDRSTTDTGFEPTYSFTAQELEDLKTDEFRRGYRLGRVHEAEAHAGRGRPVTTRTA